ncbi:hypothetical protein [Hydrogenophaga electricum]|uniref:Uncharacterized protein n=1 Tax=Hydrogenophaga electricum TaxID=1230953 RepID=A0ABQ6C8N9_9BURK|nr:hypothetical protein [Hydrogenophaga electricum]GLS16648.1 hypothetical protein GCM10007935_40910 [Hydrogenophaga electricum]
MKTLIWSLTALLAVLWTGLAVLTHRVTDWLLGTLAAGALDQAAGSVGAPTPPALPDWLAPWLDTATLAAWQALAADLLRGLSAVLPSGDAVMAWLGPLIGVGWGLGMALLLAVAGVLHWLAGRWNPARTAPGPQPGFGR